MTHWMMTEDAGFIEDHFGKDEQLEAVRQQLIDSLLDVRKEFARGRPSS